ncbi:MAG: hypothetical protein WKH64_17800, partial [Chloroflexia bacterium]
VESFPAKVRYTSVSLPYHIGNGYFGGFLPFIAAAVGASAAASTAPWTVPLLGWAIPDQYTGLIYPVVIASITFVLGMLLIRETKDNQITAEEREPTEKYPSNPLVLALMVGLTLGALVLADQYLMPTLSANPDTASLIQWFFRGLFLILVARSACCCGADADERAPTVTSTSRRLASSLPSRGRATEDRPLRPVHRPAFAASTRHRMLASTVRHVVPARRRRSPVRLGKRVGGAASGPGPPTRTTVAEPLRESTRQ